MIYSSAIKKYIVRYFLDNSTVPLQESADKISTYLKNNFLVHEEVTIIDLKKQGEIINCTNNNYIIKIGDLEVHAKSTDILRRDKITSQEIKTFLESNTKISPFGRVLRQNVVQQFKNTPQTETITLNIKPTQRSKKDIKKEAVDKESIQQLNSVANEFIKKKKEFISDEGEIDTKNKKTKFFFSELKPKSRLNIKQNEKLDLYDEMVFQVLDLIEKIDTKYNFYKEEMKKLIFSRKLKGIDEDILIIQNFRGFLINKEAYEESFSNEKKFCDAMDRFFNSSDSPSKKKVKKNYKFEDFFLKHSFEEILIEEKKLVYEIYMAFFIYRKSFNLEFTINEFIEALKDTDYNSQLVFQIHKELFEIIKEEFKSSSKNQFKQIIDYSLKLNTEEVYKNVAPFKKYNWSSVNFTIENWKLQIKNFFSYIFNVLEFERIVFLNEFLGGESSYLDRLINLRFLLHCVYGTNKFRLQVNSGFEESRKLERKRNELINTIKLLKGKQGTLDAKQDISNDLKVINEQIKENELLILTSGIKGELVYVENVLFFFLDSLYFWKEERLFKMNENQMEDLVKEVYGCSTIHCVLGSLKNYLEVFKGK